MAIANDRMKEGRFLRWHEARQRCRKVVAHLEAGGLIIVGSYTRPVKYTRKHASMFVAKKDGLYVKRGKSLDCLNFSPIGFYS